MNLKKLMDKINGLHDQIQNLVNEEKFDEAAKLREEYDSAKESYEALKDLELQQMQAGTPATGQEPVDDERKKFFNAFRNGFRNIMSEGTPANGGYTVPQDIQTSINRYKETHRSLRDLVSVEAVRTNKGSRVYETKTAVAGFSKVNENGLLQAMSEPTFTQVSFEVEDYGGYMPVTNDLLADSDVNIEGEITNWIGRNDLKSDNNEILAILKTGEAVTVSNLDDIAKAIIVTIGSAYDSVIVTNDDGINWLASLKDTNKRPLLNPDPTAPAKMQLRCGAKVVAVEQFPNADIPSGSTYKQTADATLKTGKTYYTASSGVYTAVAEPDVDDIATYYEVDKAVIPFIMGDLKEAVRVYDRQQTTLYGSSDAAVVDSNGKVIYNAFQQRGKLYRADTRKDYKEIDHDAFVYGTLTI